MLVGVNVAAAEKADPSDVMARDTAECSAPPAGCKYTGVDAYSKAA
jgi:hypothetical protein